MANIILTLDRESPQKYSLEVYKDLSFVSVDSVSDSWSNIQDNLSIIYSDGTIHKILDKTINNDYPFSTLNANTPKSKISSHQSLSTWKLNKLVNLKAIFNSLYNIFHWLPGERIINPEFGSKLYLLLYNGITTFTQEQIVSEIRNAVTIWEPRVNIVKVINATDVNAIENNTIKIDVLFTVPTLDNNQYIYSYIQNRNGE